MRNLKHFKQKYNVTINNIPHTLQVDLVPNRLGVGYTNNVTIEANKSKAKCCFVIKQPSLDECDDISSFKDNVDNIDVYMVGDDGKEKYVDDFFILFETIGDELGINEYGMDIVYIVNGCIRLRKAMQLFAVDVARCMYRPVPMEMFDKASIMLKYGWGSMRDSLSNVMFDRFVSYVHQMVGIVNGYVNRIEQYSRGDWYSNNTTPLDMVDRKNSRVIASISKTRNTKTDTYSYGVIVSPDIGNLNPVDCFAIAIDRDGKINMDILDLRYSMPDIYHAIGVSFNVFCKMQYVHPTMKPYVDLVYDVAMGVLDEYKKDKTYDIDFCNHEKTVAAFLKHLIERLNEAHTKE